jgi:hypothetical protein
LPGSDKQNKPYQNWQPYFKKDLVICKWRCKMKKNGNCHKPFRLAGYVYTVSLVSLVLAIALGLTGRVALAAPMSVTAPGLGAVASFSVLGKAGVTNTGPSTLSGNVGADSSITGFPPGKAAETFVAPAVNGAEAAAKTADLELTAQASSAKPAGPNLTGATLVPGIYSVGSALLPGVLTLNGAGVYIFLASDLTASGSVKLTNGASACNVFWHITSAAAITGGSFAGTIIAGTSVTFGNAASLDGRALALTGNVTLINNSISGPSCAAVPAATATTGLNATTVPATSVASATTPPAATSLPGATAVSTSTVPGATAVPAVSVTDVTAAPFLLPVTGADLTEAQGQSSLQILIADLGFLGLGIIGLGLALLGFGVFRKREN